MQEFWVLELKVMGGWLWWGARWLCVEGCSFSHMLGSPDFVGVCAWASIQPVEVAGWSIACNAHKVISLDPIVMVAVSKMSIVWSVCMCNFASPCQLQHVNRSTNIHRWIMWFREQTIKSCNGALTWGNQVIQGRWYVLMGYLLEECLRSHRLPISSVQKCY